MATMTTLSAAELRAGLEELLALADQCCALEGRIESKAIELEKADWGSDLQLPNYANALAGQLRGIFTETNADTRQNEWDPDVLAGEIRAALKILDLAQVETGDGR